MKLTAFLLTALCMQVSASVYSQRISISKESVPLERVLKEIRAQSGYLFLYDLELMERARPVTVRVRRATLEEALEQCLRGQPISYEIINKTIVLKQRRDAAPVPPPQALNADTLRGRVIDSLGAPLPGISVTVKDAGRGTVTDENGRYELLNVEDDDILVFSMIGYRQEEVPVNGRQVVDVILSADIARLEEVVVVGYGTQRRSDLTGSISQVKPEEITAFPSANLLQGVAGRAPGIHIRQGSGSPGAPITVRIRGGNSIQGSSEPLYVIDGFPISGNPTQLNSSEIESVEILKDASATAIYGSRGANGVVIITTKRGRAGKAQVSFETSYSTQNLIKSLDLMNAREYAVFYNEQAANDGLDPYFSEEEINSFGEGFDWQDFVFRSAPMHNSSLNVSGGNERTLFSISGSVFGQDGIIKGSDYKRYSLQANLNHKISDKFSIDFASTLSRLTTERKDSDGGFRGSSMIAAAVSAPPTLTPYNEDGSYTVLSTAYPFMATDIRNPINFINEQSNVIRANTALINAALSYHIIPGLTLKVSGGIENRDDRQDNYTTTKFFNSQGSASVSTRQEMSLLNENTLTYQRTFAGQHHLTALAGFTYQDFKTTTLGASGSGFLSDIFETYDLGAAANPNVPGSGYSKAVLLSYLGRVNYNYADRYLLTVSLRRDGSSRYSEGHKWGYFPSAAAAWRLSNESFLEGSGLISDLKLRTSWGLTGSQAVSPYMTLNQLDPGRTVFGDEYANTFAPGTRLPGDLKWETTEQFDVGFDLGILNDRLVLSADYYVKNTRDLLSTVILPSSMGYTSTTQNVGKIQNKGFEFNLDARALEGGVRWNMNVNLSFNRSKVMQLYEGEDIFRDNVSVVAINDVTSILREGQPVGRFWGYLEEGYDENGRIIFSDLNGDGAISPADKTYIGDPNPDMLYGFSSTLSYRNFQLDLFVQGTLGNDIFNASAITNTMDYGFGLNMPRWVFEDHWSPSNPNARYPKISNSTNLRVSDRFIEDGSYLRLKNIMLAYNLPVETIRLSWVRSLQLYVSGQNLLTLTDYSWWDPETNFRLDHNSYPLARSLTFGIRAGF